MKKATYILLTIFSFSAFGNDGIYLTRGGVIYPTVENSISIDKEILSFKVIDKKCLVNIQFEFYNHDSVNKKLIVGFQAPTANGDVSDSICNLNQIENFTIVNNGKIIPYKLKAAECEDCVLKEPNQFRFSQSEPGVFIFLFEIDFQPGLNKISHSYSFPATSNVAFDQIYNYILTTGAKWKGGAIKEFEMQIDLGENCYFFVKDIFGENSTWNIIGTGKVTETSFINYDDNENKMIRILSGYLKVTSNDLKPTENIEFGIIDDYSFITAPTDFQKIQDGKVLGISDFYINPDYNYSKKDLRLIRNTVYAQYGFDFNSMDLKEYFSQFDWYMPNPNLKLDDIKLSKEEKEFIELILKMEEE